MEGAYLNLLDFRLKISSQEYAKAYFLMRTYAESKNRSCTLRPLDVATVLKLQNAAPRAEEEFKKIHADSLYKTL